MTSTCFMAPPVSDLTVSDLTVSDQIELRRAVLTPAERAAASAVLSEPETVAFGTAADAVRRELAPRWHPTTDGTGGSADDAIGRTLAAELANVASTLEALDRTRFAEAARLLSGADRPPGRVLVLAGDGAQGAGVVIANELAQLRAGVELLGNSEAAIARGLRHAGPSDVLALVDVSPSDQIVMRAVREAAAQPLQIVAVTDAPLPPSVGGRYGELFDSRANTGEFVLEPFADSGPTY